MNRALQLLLLFSALVFGLAVPGMIIVSHVSGRTAGLWGGAAALLAIVAAGLLGRSPLGWALAWLTQVAGLLLGILTPMMLVVGAIFAGLFLLSFVLGRRIEDAPPRA